MVSNKIPSVESTPCVRVQGAPTPHPLQDSASRILVIEDNVDANNTLCEFLRLEGHTVSSAFNGLTGAAMAVEGDYDLLLCDIGLPGLNGYEVASRVQRASLPRPPCCIAMTGYNQQAQIDQAVEAGFDFYLVKPVAIDRLLELISKNGRPAQSG